MKSIRWCWFGMFALLGAAPALACNPKTGKQCSTEVGSKADLRAKKTRSALLGNRWTSGAALGATTPLGLADAPLAPPEQTAAAGGTPDGWWCLPPGTTNHGRPTSYETLVNTQNNMRAHGRQATLVNPDGSLGPTMLANGWIRLAPVKPMAVPNQVAVIAPPVPLSGTTPQLLPQPMRVPGQLPPDQAPVAQPGAVPGLVAQPMRVPGQLPPAQTPAVQPALTPALASSGVPAISGFGAAGRLPETTARTHQERPVHVYHGTAGGIYRNVDAPQVRDATFHLVVIGFKEP
jgi:hypothetical protein